MNNGIPPSIDRQDKLATLVIGSIILIAMFVAALYVVVGRSLRSHESAGAGETQSESPRLDAYLAEEERASAYAALRVYMDQMAGEPGIAAVFCRDCSHYWDGDVIVFHGQVDFKTEAGEMESHDYTARLQGSKQEGWEVLSAELAEGEAPVPL